MGFIRFSGLCTNHALRLWPALCYSLVVSIGALSCAPVASKPHSLESPSMQESNSYAIPSSSGITKPSTDQEDAHASNEFTRYSAVGWGQPLSELDLQNLETSAPTTQTLEELRDRLNLLSDGFRGFVQDDLFPLTRLRGEAIYGLEAINTLQRVDDDVANGKHFYIGYRLRLNIETSFNGSDRLRIRLQSRTIPELGDVVGTPLVNLSFDGDDGGKVEISDIWYRFKLFPRTDVTITAIGASLRDSVPSVNPFFNGSSRGSVSVFGSEDPILRGVSGVGLALSHDFTHALNLTAAATSRDRSARDSGVGLPGDRRASIVQLTYSPDSSFTAALAWNSSRNEGFLRSQFDESDSISGNAFSGEIFYRPYKYFSVGLRAGLIRAVAKDLEGSPRRNYASYAALIGFPDLGLKGNLLGFVVGRPPFLNASSEVGLDAPSPFHFEVFYRYALSDFLSITPGVVFVKAPTDGGGLQGYWVGAFRMTFRF